MPKGRPGGNPELEKYHFEPRYDWPEPCDVRMTLRLPRSMKDALKNGEIEDWQEFVRRAIARELGWDLGVEEAEGS